MGSLSVGGGHRRRALAHGYSILNPFGVQNPSLDFLTPGVQPKIWVKVSPGERGDPPAGGSPLCRRGDRGLLSTDISPSDKMYKLQGADTWVGLGRGEPRPYRPYSEQRTTGPRQKGPNSMISQPNETVETSETNETLFYFYCGARDLGCGNKGEIPAISKKCNVS